MKPKSFPTTTDNTTFSIHGWSFLFDVAVFTANIRTFWQFFLSRTRNSKDEGP